MKKIMAVILTAIMLLLCCQSVLAANQSSGDGLITKNVASVVYFQGGSPRSLGTYDTLDAAFEALETLYTPVLSAGIADGDDADTNNGNELYEAAGSPIIMLNGNFAGAPCYPDWIFDAYDKNNVVTIVVDGAKSDTENYCISCNDITLFDRLAFYNLTVRNTNITFTSGNTKEDNNIRWNGNVFNSGNKIIVPGESFTVFENCRIEQTSTLSSANASGGLFKMNGHKRALNGIDSVEGDKFNLTLKDCEIYSDAAVGLQVHWGADADIYLKNTTWTMGGAAGCNNNNDCILKSYEAGTIYMSIDGSSKLIGKRTQGSATIALIRNLDTMAGTCTYELGKGAELIMDNSSTAMISQSFIAMAYANSYVIDNGALYTITEQSLSKSGVTFPVNIANTASTLGFINNNNEYFDAGSICKIAGTYYNIAYSSDGFGMIDGAAIRTVDGEWGIRFSAYMSDEFLAGLGDDPEYGMVFNYGNSASFNPYITAPAYSVKSTRLEKGFMGYDNVFHVAIMFESPEYEEKEAYLKSVKACAYFVTERSDGERVKLYSIFGENNVRSMYSVATRLAASDSAYAENPLVKNILGVSERIDANAFIPALFPEAKVLGSSPTCKEIILSDANKTEIVSTFTNAGFKPVTVNMIEGAKIETLMFKRDTDIVTMYWYESTGEMRIMWEASYDNALDPLTPNAETGTGTIELAQIGTERVSENDNPLNGMCYIVKLSNGSAIIVDGGFENNSCANNIFNTLEKLGIAKDADGKFLIEAWIFSHPHGDHFGTFMNFSTLYGQKTVLKYLVHNFPGDTQVSSNETVRSERLSACFPGAKRVNPHAGLKYYFGNVTVEMLYTPELLYSNNGPIGYSNDTSLIFKFSAGGASMLCYGDSGNEASRAMWNAYESSVFKVDILQINHHGLYTTANNGHTWDYVKKVYEAAEAPYAFLPMHSKYGPDQRNGRFTVMIQWCNSGYQISFVMNENDNHGLNKSSITQKYYEDFVKAVKAGTNTNETLYGYNGINKIVNENGMVTYTGANNDTPMITMFTFGNGTATLTVNEELYTWLESDTPSAS